MHVLLLNAKEVHSHAVNIKVSLGTVLLWWDDALRLSANGNTQM